MCHQSVGLVARAIEEAGVPTLCMTSAWDITYSVRPPRSVFVNFPLNHQVGKPHDAALQRSIILDALKAFEMFWAPGQMLCLPYVWDPENTTWEEKDYGPEAVLYGTGQSLQKEYAEGVLSRARGG